jgi:hypothetical protein
MSYGRLWGKRTWFGLDRGLVGKALSGGVESGWVMGWDLVCGLMVGWAMHGRFTVVDVDGFGRGGAVQCLLGLADY